MSLNGKNLILSAIATSLLSISVVPPSHAEYVDPDRGNPQLVHRGQNVDQIIADFMNDKAVSGISLAIVQSPYIQRVTSYGIADTERGSPASIGTMWNIGPITQGFSAVAIMQLVEANKIQLDSPIDIYVQNLPEAWTKITIKQLMQHATGIADYREIPGFDMSQAYPPQALINGVRDKPLSFRPGTQVSQSATNFLLLGLAIEKASGMSYHDMIWNGQIKPLGLRHTMFAEDFPSHTQQDQIGQTDNRDARLTADSAYINPSEPASGYTLKERKATPVARNTSSSLFAFGSLWASAKDVSMWAIALAGDVLIKQKSHRDLISNPTKLDNGTLVPAMAGWQFTGHKGFMDIKGSVPGYSAYQARFTEKDELFGVTLIANQDNVDLTELARRIATAYDATLGSNVDPSQQKTYESSYSVDETTARLEQNIKAAGGKVFASLDQTAYAKEVGMELRPTRLIIFGNPKAGTKLMQGSVSVAADLPLRIAVWMDDRNQTWIGYSDLDQLAKRNDVKDQVTLNQMKASIEEIVRKSASVY